MRLDKTATWLEYAAADGSFVARFPGEAAHFYRHMGDVDYSGRRVKTGDYLFLLETLEFTNAAAVAQAQEYLASEATPKGYKTETARVIPGTDILEFIAFNADNGVKQMTRRYTFDNRVYHLTVFAPRTAWNQSVADGFFKAFVPRQKKAWRCLQPVEEKHWFVYGDRVDVTLRFPSAPKPDKRVDGATFAGPCLVLSVLREPYPVENIAQLRREAAEGLKFAQMYNARRLGVEPTLLSQRELKVDGAPAIEYCQRTSPRVTGCVRHILINNVQYVLSAAWSTKQKPPAATYFLDSLRYIKERKVPAPARQPQ